MKFLDDWHFRVDAPSHLFLDSNDPYGYLMSMEMVDMMRTDPRIQANRDTARQIRREIQFFYFRNIGEARRFGPFWRMVDRLRKRQ